MTLQEKVKANTIGLLNSFTPLTQTQIEFKPVENKWSILECVEHIFLIDTAISKIMNTPAPEKIENTKPELYGAEKLNHMLVAKRDEFKVPSPDPFIPKGIIKTTEDAATNINSITAKIIAHLDTNDISKELHTMKHTRLGEMTKVDWIHFLIAHTNRHIVQIEEAKKLL